MKFSRLAVIIYPLFIWLLSQSYFIWPEILYISLGLSLLLTGLLAFLIKSPEHKTPWWATAILPISFLFSITAYISLQSNWIVTQLLFLLLVIFLFSYFKNLYYFWHRIDLYQKETNNIIKAYGGFLIVFFAAADLYGLQSLLSLTVWPIFLMFLTLISAVIYLNLNLENIDKKGIIQFSVINIALIAEMAVVFIFLPLNYNVSALSVGIVYYLCINMTRLYLQQSLTAKKIKLYLIISCAALALLLLTARWLN